MADRRHARVLLVLLLAARAMVWIPAGAQDAQPTDAQRVLWLDAMDLDGNGSPDTRDDDTPVTRWHDRTASQNHAHQPAAAMRPTYRDGSTRGYPALRFDGKQWLATDLKFDWSATDWTAVAVATLDADAPDAYRGIMGNRFGPGRANWWTLGSKGDGTLYLELAAGVGVQTRIRVADSKPHVYTVVKRGNTFELFRDGTSLGTAQRDNVGGETNQFRVGLWFGANQGWTGRLSEVQLYDSPLGESSRKSLEDHLISKWELVPPDNLYSRQGNWADTMVACREALSRVQAGEKQSTRRDWRAYVWERVRADFPGPARAFEASGTRTEVLAWFLPRESSRLEQALVGDAGSKIERRLATMRQEGVAVGDVRWLALIVEAQETRQRHQNAQRLVERINLPALRRAVAHLQKTYPLAYQKGEAFLREVDDWEQDIPALLESLTSCADGALDRAQALLTFQSEALLANPELDFEGLLFVRRGLSSPRLGLPQNWQSNCILPRSGYDDEIAVLSPPAPDGKANTLYRPDKPVFVGDVDLHFDADRLLFSSIGTQNRWQIFEVGMDGTGLRQVTPGDQPDVDNYDACYLPDGDIMFCSNAYYAAVPCVNGSARTAVLYRMGADGTGIRQLCFDQEHNWCPTMLNNGRVMYLRWEYTDTPHSHDRVLFHMNPDGTEQMEYYGSNSYWPNSLFYAKPIPGDPSKFVGIVGGHHGVPRMGELVLFDPQRGRREAEGAIQRIPGHGIPVASTTNPKYQSSLIQDRLVDASWPKFLHPHPLSETTFLVACKPSPEALWGIYLVDIFDNMLLLREEPGHALLEPVPVRKRAAPPVIPSKVNLERDDALVHLTDVYQGDGLAGVPRGTVTSLRVISYHFLYPGMGGPQAVVGMEGPWDIKRILGTVPVSEDGGAYFRVPANTPIAVQPLDSEGRAVQLMRSWFTAMPGELLSCVGCHESQNSAPPAKPTQAMLRPPSEIQPWYGPARGFNFEREVQPVLDKYCISCHDGSDMAAQPTLPGPALTMPNLQERAHITDYRSVFHSGRKDAGHFSVSYADLHRFVRRPGLESDYHLLTPMEFHANTTQLVQMLQKGHHGVSLDREAWDRLNTWIDLNAPYHGTWHEIAGKERTAQPARRRRELLKLYADTDQDYEAIPDLPYDLGDAVPPSPVIRPQSPPPSCPGWPFSPDEAKRRQEVAGQAMQGVPEGSLSHRQSIALGQGLSLELVLIPAGRFVMGSRQGYADEVPETVVEIREPFWMGTMEVTNAQFEAFDPDHDSRVEHRFSMQFGVRGFYVNGPEQPAVRVSWEEAMAFCAWLEEKTGRSFTLPSEAQWEYACRAGADQAFSFGSIETDYAEHANLADQTLREFVCHTYKKERDPWLHASKYDDWIPKDLRVNDGGFLSDGVGRYRPNPWGLHDMHGNVWEWTRSAYRPYPYAEDDGRNGLDQPGDQRVVRGGSWRDRPVRARSATRLSYRPFQKVYNVGFRVVCPVSSPALAGGAGR